MKKVIFAMIISATSCVPVIAQTGSFDSMQLAMNLGSVIASEKYCGLTYNQDGIAAFIGKKVPADDMSFTSTLNMMVTGTQVQLNSMSVSAKTAHCAQISRVAKSYSFLK